MATFVNAGTMLVVIICSFIVHEATSAPSYLSDDQLERLAADEALNIDLAGNDFLEEPYGVAGEALKRGGEPDSQHLVAQKRHLCRNFFIYNPVKGRCMPTLLALRKGRKQRRASQDI